MVGVETDIPWLELNVLRLAGHNIGYLQGLHDAFSLSGAVRVGAVLPICAAPYHSEDKRNAPNHTVPLSPIRKPRNALYICKHVRTVLDLYPQSFAKPYLVGILVGIQNLKMY